MQGLAQGTNTRRNLFHSKAEHLGLEPLLNPSEKDVELDFVFCFHLVSKFGMNIPDTNWRESNCLSKFSRAERKCPLLAAEKSGDNYE